MEGPLRNTILVPTDFSSIGECAITYATEIASLTGYDICLLHIVNQNATKAEKENANDQLIKLSQEFSKKTGLTISYHLKEGSIFNSITNSVIDLNANLIVIGVHGASREDNIIGSFAYNVICSSKVPVLAVKKCNSELKDNTMVLPVDFTQDNTEAVNIAIKYAKLFNVSVNVTGVLYSKTSLYKTIVSKEKKEAQIEQIASTIKKAGIDVKSDILIKPKTILVPTDFTPVAAKAIDHAVEIAKTFERKICLLHVVGKDAKPEHLENVEKQLKNTADKIHKRYNIDISYKIKTGSIFDAIPNTVGEISAGLMVIGFHGKQGVEHVAGGFAYTVIRNSTVPVMVVKKNHLDISDNHIVVPINFPHEDVDKVHKSIKFAKKYKCPVHIIGVLNIDNIEAKNKKDAILDKISKYMAKKGVKFISEVLIRSNSILVPVDFTPVANYAISYALEIAKASKQNICLLHIIDGNIKNSEKEKIVRKLDEVAADASSKSGVTVSHIIEEGNIFDVISGTALEISAELVIMGVHGKKGLQHILGSNAFKVIKSSQVPVMVVRKDFPKESIKNIAVPINVEHESTKKIFKAIDFAKYFGANVHVTSFLHSQGVVYKIEKEALVKNVASHIENAGIKVKTEIIQVSKANAEEKFLKYAESVGADLIILVAKKSSKLSELMGQNFAEQIINKSNIPILNIIPYAEFDEDESYAVGSFVDPLGLMRKES